MASATPRGALVLVSEGWPDVDEATAARAEIALTLIDAIESLTLPGIAGLDVGGLRFPVQAAH